MKHGDVNATLPDRDKVDSLTLEEAVALLAEKAGKQGTAAPSKAKRATRAKTASEPRAAYAAAAKTRKADAVAKPAVKRTAGSRWQSGRRPSQPRRLLKTAPKTKPAAKARRIVAK